jgi:hypothetical protein
LLAREAAETGKARTLAVVGIALASAFATALLGLGKRVCLPLGATLKLARIASVGRVALAQTVDWLAIGLLSGVGTVHIHDTEPASTALAI